MSETAPEEPTTDTDPMSLYDMMASAPWASGDNATGLATYGRGGKKGGGKKKKKDEPTGPYDGGGSAAAIIQNALETFGLGELGEWAWKRHLAGDSLDEIMLKMRQQDAYIERFPAMAELGAQGQAITEGEYVQYERAVEQLSLRYGIPDGVYNDRQAIAQLLIKDFSPVEIEQNMRQAASVVYGSPEIRAKFAEFYGVQGDGAAIAYFLDPEANQQALERAYAATQIAGSALALGLDTAQRTAERIATLVNPSEQQAQATAFQASRDAGLYTELLGESEDVTADQGLLTAYGADADAAETIRKRRSSRQAAYSGGGSLAAGQEGVSGLSSAGT